MAIQYSVPVGTPPAVCKSAECRKVIYWIKTDGGKNMPVDCEAPGGKVPSKIMPGQGVPHWGTCVAAKSFTKAKN